MDPTLVDAVAPVRARAPGAVLAFDFDGTLSPVVPDPAAARPGPGVIDALLALVGRYRQLVVLSGRPISFLADHLPDAIDLVGLYGLERRTDGVVAEHPAAARWRPVVGDVVAQARAATAAGTPLEGVVVEAKGLSVTVHVRTRPDLADAAAALVAELAASSGLELRRAKASYELHPPVAVDKGTALEELATGADAVLYVGDDVGDLPAFAALDRLAAAGTVAVGVVVGGAELPPALAGLGAVELADQRRVVELLAALGG